MKGARAGASYVILTKQIKLQHEKTPTSYLISIQNLGFQQTATELIDIFVA